MVKHTEICLDSLLQTGTAREFIEIPEQRREEGCLRQRCRLRGISRQLTLFNGHFLMWEESLSGRFNSRRHVNLAYIDPQPVFRRQLASERLVAGGVALMLAGFALMAAAWALAGVLGGIGLLLLLTGYQRSYDRAVFRTRTGQLAVFEMFCRAPNRREAQAWIALISERARHAAGILPAGREGLAAEMAEHRRMAAEGWLSRPRYERARKRIMARFNGQVRGEAGETRGRAGKAPTSHQNPGTASAQYARLAS